MKTIKLLLLLGVGALLANCATAPEGASAKAPESSKGILNAYKIGVGDMLDINVWKNPELSLSIPVRPDGKISMPLIGEIQAYGETPKDLSENIQSQLVNFLRNPQVTVIVSNAASADFQNRVRVTGAVNQPVSIPYRSGMTVLDLVLEAGGVNEFAMPNRAVLYRKSATDVKSYQIKLNDILKKGELKSNYQVLPSDILIVPERVL